MSSHTISSISKAGASDIVAANTRASKGEFNAPQKIMLQRAAIAPVVEPDAERKVKDALRSSGQPLDARTRESQEPRFGFDFSGVRVHADSAAAESARAVHAHAYAVGRDLVFNEGQYAPSTAAGQERLTHELTHVVQQASGPVEGASVSEGLAVSHPGDRFERAAAAQATSVKSTLHEHSSGGSRARDGVAYLQRDAAADVTLGSGVAQGVGGILSGIGALAALGPAGRAADAAARQAAAAEKAVEISEDPPVAAPLTGGVTVTQAEIKNVKGPAKPAETKKASKEKAASKTAPEPEEALPGDDKPPIPLFQVGTSAGDYAKVNLSMQTVEDRDIVSASTETGDVNGYLGGSKGSNLTVNLKAAAAKPEGGKAVVQIKFDGTNVGPHASQRIGRFRGVAKANAAGQLVGPVKISPSGNGASGADGAPAKTSLDVAVVNKKEK